MRETKLRKRLPDQPPGEKNAVRDRTSVDTPPGGPSGISPGPDQPHAAVKPREPAPEGSASAGAHPAGGTGE